MISETFSRAFAIAKERWAPILGATLVPLIGAVVVLLVLGSMLVGMAAGGVEAAGSDLGSSGMVVDPSTGLPMGATGGSITVNGEPVAFDGAAEETDGAGGGIGFVLLMLATMAAMGVLMCAVVLAGVAAAAGNAVGESIGVGFRSLPHAVVQVLKVAWPAIAAFVVMVVAFTLNVILGLVLVPVWLIMYLRAIGVATVAIGSVAYGHTTFSVDHVRAAVDGRVGQAGSAAFVSNLFGGVIGLIPVAGAFLQVVWASAFTAAMWEEFDGSSPVGGGDGFASSGGSAADAPPVTSYDATSSDVPAAAGTPAAAVAVPAAIAAGAAAAAAAPTTAGPNWYAAATPTEPAGSWVQLAAPGRVTLQVQWVTGPAPALHVADEAGTWRTPDVQPTASGEPVALDLPAGNSWVALVPSEQQQLWCSTLVPAGAGMPPATAA